MPIITRRQVALGLPALALTGALRPRPLRAQDGPVIVGVYAGLFENAVRETFVKDFTARTGVPVEFSIGGPSQWLSQVNANPDNPPVDVILASPRDAVREGPSGIYDKMTAGKLSNLPDIPANFVDMCDGYGVSFDYGACGFAVNTDRVKNPPKSIKEFIERTAAGEWYASLPTLSWQATPANLIWSFNDALGGSMEDISPFIDAMKSMKPNLISWTGMPDVLTQLGSGEADIALYTDGRTWAAHFSGAENLSFINPEEGAVVETVAAMKPVKAHPAAWDFIDTMLDPVQQAAFSDITYFGTTNSKVVYSDKVKDIVTRWQQGRLVPTAEIAAQTPAWVERWNRELGA